MLDAVCGSESTNLPRLQLKPYRNILLPRAQRLQDRTVLERTQVREGISYRVWCRMRGEIPSANYFGFIFDHLC